MAASNGTRYRRRRGEPWFVLALLASLVALSGALAPAAHTKPVADWGPSKNPEAQGIRVTWVMDEPATSRDGAVNPGETVRFSLKLRNIWREPATVSFKLDPSRGGWNPKGMVQEPPAAAEQTIPPGETRVLPGPTVTLRDHEGESQIVIVGRLTVQRGDIPRRVHVEHRARVASAPVKTTSDARSVTSSAGTIASVPARAGAIAAIHGIARSGLDRARMAGAHVVVTDCDVTTIYGEATTTMGANGGWYQVTSLPAGTDLTVFVFHDALPGCIAATLLHLNPGVLPTDFANAASPFRAASARVETASATRVTGFDCVWLNAGQNSFAGHSDLLRDTSTCG